MPTSEEFDVLLLSLRVALVGTVIGLPLGLLIAWVLAKSSSRCKVLLDTLVSFPLVLPPVVTGYALLLLLGRNGPFGGLQDDLGIEIMFTWFAAALAAGLVSLPLMVRSMEVAMAGVDHRFELVARSLGAGRLKVFVTVTAPLAFRGILAGVILGFARGMGEFGATIIVAGNIPGHTQTLPLAIFTNLQVGNDDAAMRFIVFSLVVALAALLTHRWILKRAVI
ncbi:MAG: molybdate ABC transporter permease subunit [Chloroflexota bacterium]|nr:molybdate ABC transporter permease subunit [Chloroflexota bacterium]